MSFTRSKSGVAKRRRATLKSRGDGSRNSTTNVKESTKQKAIPDSHITPSCGNIFEDVGFPPDEARNLLLRADLMLTIGLLIKKRHLTQAQAAKLFGVTQPRISDLVRRKIDRFSIDMLVDMLARAGMNVTLAVEPRAA